MNMIPGPGARPRSNASHHQAVGITRWCPNPVSETASSPNLVVQRTSSGVLRVLLSGNWRAPGGLPGVETITQSLKASSAERSLEFDVTSLTGWDSRLVGLIHKCVA